MKPRRRQQHLVCGVVYVLMSLVVIGTALAVMGPVLTTVAPTEPKSEVASTSWMTSRPASAPASGAASALRSAPVVVSVANNPTWADLQERAFREGAGESSDPPGVGSAADCLLAFARWGGLINLSVRTPADRTYPVDVWLTLGRGRCASVVEAFTSYAGPIVAISRSTSLVEAPGQDASIQTAGLGTQLTTGALGSLANRPAPVVSSVTQTLAADASLTIIDTVGATSTDFERVAALDEALHMVQEQPRLDTHIITAPLIDDEVPGPQTVILSAGTRSARDTFGGLVVGDSTHQVGLIQLTDLTPIPVPALGGRRDPAFNGRMLMLPKTGRAGVAAAGAVVGDTRTSRLADDVLHTHASQATVMRAGTLFMGLAMTPLARTVVVLRALRTSRREVLRRQVAWVTVCLNGPLTASLLVNAAPQWHVGAQAGFPPGWASLVAVATVVLIVVGIVGLAAGIVALVRWCW